MRDEKVKLNRSEERTEIVVPHLGKDLVFIYQEFGPDSYANVGTAIERAGLRKPTMAETVSLMHGIEFYHSFPEEMYMIYQKASFCGGLWAFTGNLWTPEAVYIQDNPEIRDGMPYMDWDTLRKKIDEGDLSVRVVPQEGMAVGYRRAQGLSKSPYLIGLVGEEGAKKLEEIARKCDTVPYLRLDPEIRFLEKSTVGDGTLETRVSAFKYRYVRGRTQIVIDGTNYGEEPEGKFSGGYAFAVVR